MSRRHTVRLLSDGRYVCGARGCKFTGSLADATRHVLAHEAKAA